ncbi:MAG: hypothetical protein ACLP9L_39820 [Thermoguttaceae bacterium]
MNPKCWLLEGYVARLNLPGLSLVFDADRPADGLAKIVVLDRPWSGGRLMGITGSLQSAVTTTLADWHVRGDDLIAVYETGQPDAARVDLLWHVARPATGEPWLARVDLLVSVRTDRLDWRHDVRLESVLPEVSVIENLDSMENMFVARGWSLGMMVHPADLGRQELTAETDVSLAHHLRQQLFRTESLEKGVILRARATAWFLPSGVDRSAMAAYFADFAVAEPPLA